MTNIKDKTNGDMKQFVTFEVDTEEYGLEILRVQEVVRLPKLTKLPRAPHFIKGVIDLRGDVIPIIDLREKFGLTGHDYKENTRTIIVEVKEKKIGMIVDNVSQVVRVADSNIAPPPPSIGGVSNNLISGVIRMDDRLIILMNVENVLSTEEIVQLDKIDQVEAA